MNKMNRFSRFALFLDGAAVYTALMAAPSAQAQTQENPQITALAPPNTYQITWPGVSGRLYFVQFSTDLQTWTYAPTVNLGIGANIAYGFSSTTARAYVRLKYSVATNFTSAADGDFDGDGISNLEEVTYFQTDPTVSDDTDGDGYLDSDETAQGSNPALATSTPFDPQTPPPAQWYVGTMDGYYNKFLLDSAEVAFRETTTPGTIAQVTDRATALADGSFDLPFLTIQAAVNAAQPGDLIQVAPGTYAGGINLTARNVKIIGMPGQRDATIINGGAIGLDFGAANSTATVVSGLTIRGATTSAMRLQAGASPIIANCVLDANAAGIDSTASSPRLFNTVIGSQTNGAAVGNGVVATGAGTVRLTFCSVLDNLRQAGSGQIRAANGALIELRNSIVRSEGTVALGNQIVTTGGGSVSATYSNIAQAFVGTGNINVAPLFDAAFPAERRIQRLSPGVDAADIRGLAGYFYLTRRDFDGELRGLAYNVAAPTGLADMGADEYVSRLTFATITRNIDGAQVPLSEVDEASDVAALGQVPGTGDARISIVNDETIDDINGNSFNQTKLFTISAATGDIVTAQTQSIDLRRGAGGGNEVKDPEVVCYDAANRRLFVLTSQTKVNKYRDCEGTNIDPLVDPPVNDYDPRRANVVRYDVDANLNALANPARYDGNDGAWLGNNAARRDMDAFQQGISLNGTNAVSPTGYDSPTGLVASLRAGIQGNAAFPALQATNLKNAGVLLAWSTSPRFGTPVNGTQYTAGTQIPYTGLGGPGTGGTSLGNQAAAPGAAGIVHNGRTANTTYYYRAWAYDAAFNYGRPLDAQTTTDGNPPLLVNEIEGSGVDFIEVFNASGVAVNVGGRVLRDDNLARGDFFPVPANTIIAARGTQAFVGFAFGIGNGSDDATVFLNGGVGLQPFTRYGQFTRNQQNGSVQWGGLPNAEGRVWDGGPRGYQWDAGQNRFEAEGAIYRSSPGSPQPITQGGSNNNQAIKYFHATADANQNQVYLHYANMGTEPAVWSYSPKQGDGHPISVEAGAYRSPNEMIVGLRSPLSNRTMGNALYYVVNNVANFLPAGANWNGAAAGIGGVQQLNLNGQGFRSIQWVPTLNNGNGAYLIIGGPANGGPLKAETGRETFTLYQWAGPGNQPVIKIANLRGYTQRPEGVNIITLTVNGTPQQRVLFVEDRYRAQGYGSRNAIHWPISILR